MVDFIHEVEEELRKDQYNALLKRWGPLLVGLCVLIIAAAGAYEYFKSSDERLAKSTSISYVEASELASDGQTEAAMSQFIAIGEKARPGYAGLSFMQAAGLAYDEGNSGQAIAYYDRAANTFESALHSDLAQLKAAYLVMENGNYDDVSSRLTPLLREDGAFIDLARELKGMVALEQGDVEAANSQFALLARSLSVTDGIQSRAQQILAITAPLSAQELGAEVESMAAPQPSEPKKQDQDVASDELTPKTTQDTQKDID